MEFEDNNSQPEKTWLGSSISQICKDKGPWSFSVTPVTISKYHAVLYNMPVTLRDPPKPHYSTQPQHWDEDHVRMPYSEENLFPVTESGEDVILIRWKIIKNSLSKSIRTSQELEQAIYSYNSSLPKFAALHYFFEEILEEEETECFFSILLPKIIHLALQLPELVPGSFPLLKKNHNRSVSLSQLQVACLMANAFLCTFPWRKNVANAFPGVNFVRLFAAHARPKRQFCIAEKFKCLFHYFRRVTNKSPLGVITFERKFVPRSTMPRWDECDNNLGNTRIHINSSSTIEDSLGFLQVDFANKNVGGGVLGYGCVQEEIRFVICPELIISRLFIEQLGDEEAVLVTGAERYSNYSGYGDSFKWDGNIEDQTPFDEYGRRRTTICIIDATCFNKPTDQFYPSAMLRELNKAFVGFSTREKDNLAPVATGNWGCGAFKGSSLLKAVLQLMACSVAGRDLVYYSFGYESLRDEFYNMYMFLANNRITITQLWRFLCGFKGSKLSPDKLYSYIQQAYFDSKRQPSVTKFFGVTVKKKDEPSTSRNINNSTNKSKERTKEISIKQNINSGSSDEDIIPATPPADFRSKNKNRTVSKLTKDEIIEKLPKTDIAELIDIIDGTKTRKEVCDCNEESFLSQIDKIPKKLKNNKPGVNATDKADDEQIMDVDSSEDETTSNGSVDGKMVKRKISDYFQSKTFRTS